MPILAITDLLRRLLIPTAAAVFCPVSWLPCPSPQQTFTEYLGRIATGIAAAIGGIILAMIIFYSVKLATSGSDETQVSEIRSAYLHIMFGAVLVAGASWIVSIVPATSGVATPGTFISNIITPVQDFFFSMIGAALVINVGYHGARLIMAQDDSASSTARQGIFRGAIGLTMVMIGGTVLGSFTVGTTVPIQNELIGIGNFIITVFGALSLVALVAAGIMLVVSVDEQLKERAKKIIIGVGISVIVVSASRIIITVFI